MATCRRRELAAMACLQEMLAGVTELLRSCEKGPCRLHVQTACMICGTAGARGNEPFVAWCARKSFYWAVACVREGEKRKKPACVASVGPRFGPFMAP